MNRKNEGAQTRTLAELRMLLSYFKPHMSLFYLDIVSALAIAGIDLAFPAISRWVMYTLLPENAWKTFWTVMLVVTAAYLLRSAFYYIICYWGHNFGARVEADIRGDLFAHIQKLSYSFFDHNRVGQLMSRLTTDLFDVTEMSHHGPEDIFISCVTIIGSLIIMYTIQWKLALVLTVMIPIFFAVIFRCRRHMRDASRQVKSTISSINADFESELSGMRTAKAFANEKEELRRFQGANASYRCAKFGFHRAMAEFNAAMEFFLCMLSVAVISVGGALIMQGQLNVIDLITFSLYVAAFVSPIRKLSGTTEMIANGMAGFHHFAELMHTQPEIQDAENAGTLENVRGDIRVEHISFAYQENPEVLHDISLTVHAGETLALVGSSGGGKTTLSQLIPRFYDVTEGTIYVDDQDVRSVTQESLHRCIGVVSQNVFLFAGSIADNIRYGKLDATMEEIRRAAQLAEIADDIEAMPSGYDTNVGERGVLLSGGQKQRISIARIFLKNPPILILDEATSALDSVTEARIQKTFEKLSKGRTSIIIAHRLSTVRHADRIAVIEGGRIAELGTHRQLMELGGEYAQLVHTQELIIIPTANTKAEPMEMRVKSI